LFSRKKYSCCVPYKKGVRETGDQHYFGMRRSGGYRKRVCGSGVMLRQSAALPSHVPCDWLFHNVLGGLLEAAGCGLSSSMVLTTDRLGNPSRDLPFCIAGVRGWWSLWVQRMFSLCHGPGVGRSCGWPGR